MCRYPSLIKFCCIVCFISIAFIASSQDKNRNISLYNTFLFTKQISVGFSTEQSLGKKTSLMMGAYLWSNKYDDTRWNTTGIDLQTRYYFKNKEDQHLRGFYSGFHLAYSKRTNNSMGTLDFVQQFTTERMSLGIPLGYQRPIRKQFLLDVGMSGGLGFGGHSIFRNHYKHYTSSMINAWFRLGYYF